MASCYRFKFGASRAHLEQLNQEAQANLSDVCLSVSSILFQVMAVDDEHAPQTRLHPICGIIMVMIVIIVIVMRDDYLMATVAAWGRRSPYLLDLNFAPS